MIFSPPANRAAVSKTWDDLNIDALPKILAAILPKDAERYIME